MCDIDHFKRVNDTYGHTAGDEVIRKVADVIKANTRTTDLAGRYGGEEFAILLVDTSLEQALCLAERIRQQVAVLSIAFNKTVLNVTISIGLAERDISLQEHRHWIEAADKALYQSKVDGRNKVTCYSPDAE